MISAIALDDEPLALEVLEEYCARHGQILWKAGFTSPNTARNYLAQHPVDLLFLDIQMPSISGLDFYRSLPSPPMVIFSTAHPEYAVEGFNLNAADYLLKPIEYARFVQGVQKVLDYARYTQGTEGNNRYLMVRSEYSLVKIPFTEIRYVESFDDYVSIHTVGKKNVQAKMSLKALLEKLPEKDFARVHRSYVVPLAAIEAVRGKNISLDGKEIPIGQTYEADFFRKYTSQHFF